MLIITIELVSARTGKRSVLHQGEIWNDATGTATVGNYAARFGKRNSPATLATGEVKGFPRQRMGAWDLLLRALQDARRHRNNP